MLDRQKRLISRLQMENSELAQDKKDLKETLRLNKEMMNLVASATPEAEGINKVLESQVLELDNQVRRL